MSMSVWNLESKLDRHGMQLLLSLEKNTFCVHKQLSRYSDRLGTGRLRGRNSSPDRVKNCHFSTSFRQFLGATQPPIHWVQGVSFQGSKAAAPFVFMA
jgi:hypothetical protein